MSKLEPEGFAQLYRAVYEVLPNPSRTPFPSPPTLKILYKGIGSVVGFKRFSYETFEELCGLAMQECKFMPAPEWFNSRAVELSAPGRAVVTALMIAPAEEPDDPEAQARIKLLIAEADAKAIKARQDKARRAKDLTSEGYCDPNFTAWIKNNTLTLRQRFPAIARRGGSNQDRLIYRLQRERCCQIAYIESLDGPRDMRSACPNAQPLDQRAPQRQLTAR